MNFNTFKEYVIGTIERYNPNGEMLEDNTLGWIDGKANTTDNTGATPVNALNLNKMHHMLIAIRNVICGSGNDSANYQIVIDDAPYNLSDDNSLMSLIQWIVQDEVDNRNSAIQAEKQERESGDTQIREIIGESTDTEEDETVYGALRQEEFSRDQKDKEILSKIGNSTDSTTATTVYGTLNKKVAELTQADTTNSSEIQSLKTTIGTSDDSASANTVYGAIAASLAAAKQYADANDANTIYDDSAVRGLINAEASTRASEDEQILADAKKYTDDAIGGHTISSIEEDFISGLFEVEQDTLENVEEELVEETTTLNDEEGVE